MITTLTGKNSFLVHRAIKNRVNDYLKQYDDMGLERLDGQEQSAERMFEAMQSLPFLADKKLVILRCPGDQKAFAEGFKDKIQNVPEQVDVVIVEPKLDKRSSYYKTLKKETEFVEHNELDGLALTSWLVDEAKSQEGDIDRAAAQYLIDRVGPNQQRLSSELNKLLTYNASVTKQTVQLLSDRTPRSTIFELIDAAFSGDIKRTLGLYNEQRALKVEPQQIIAMLAWQLHVLAIVKTASTTMTDEIARTAKLNPFVVRKTSGIARKVTLVQLKTWIHDLRQLDEDLKSKSIDANDALQAYLVSLSS